MSTEQLPSKVDPRKLVNRDAKLTGDLRLESLEQFASSLASNEGQVKYDLSFTKDEEGYSVITGMIEADVKVTCQRCLEPMDLHIETDCALAIVFNEERSKQIPSHYDPLIVVDKVDLKEVIAEELIVSTPIVSYHQGDTCLKEYSFPSAEQAGGEQDEAAEAKKVNPFSVLEQLKSDK